ncbi:MAG: hypothetical protein DHS20C17_29540 [Cyclobacteriaceae bacterium]|nr:MAG: hypothetical protein DHS20C17_29540 [Cyclobacteriaceae bacterium]
MLLSATIFLLTSTAFAQDSLIRYEYSEMVMGTMFKLTFYAESNDKADRASKLAFGKVHQLNRVFSDFDQESEASRLAQSAGQKVKVGEDLWNLVKLSKQISRHSRGAFDISIGPLTKLWRRAIRQHQFPDSNKIRQAVELVNYRWIKLYPGKQQIKLKKPGMKLDFGGIAKGYAIDQAFRVLSNEGIQYVLIDGGGDLYINKNPPIGGSWKIKDHGGRPIEVVPPVAIASSGDSYKRLKWNGKRYSHIVDPVKGIGLQNSEIFTIMAMNATIADALATTIGLVSKTHRKKLLKKYQATLLQN